METQYDIFDKKIKVYLRKGINLEPYEHIIDLTTVRPFLLGYLKRLRVEENLTKNYYPKGTDLLFVDHREINNFNSLTPRQQLKEVITIPYQDVVSYEVLLKQVI
jgi:hypothetical protein